tara:strand:+ start:258 stop:503 length:246 start_codon:yes stop_codon:yes gene_type:complete
MLSDISNIIIEDEFIIIVTSVGSKHTIPIDNDNPTHKTFIDNMISIATSLVEETKEDVDMDAEFEPNHWGDYKDDEEDEWN